VTKNKGWKIVDCESKWQQASAMIYVARHPLNNWSGKDNVRGKVALQWCARAN